MALAVFSPVVYWNATHQWASFRFQLGHGMGPGEVSGLGNLGEYIAGQAMVWTPILFGLSLVVLAHYWRGFNRRPMVERILLCSATLTLSFFALASIRHRGEINWPGFAYLPLSLLIGLYLSSHWQGKRTGWARAGIVVAAVMTAGLHAPEAIGLIHRPVLSRIEPTGRLTLQWKPVEMSKLDDLFGWREMGQAIEQARQGSAVAAGNYRDASEAAFYTPGQPEVWSVYTPGDRLTAFDFFPNRPAYESMASVLFVGKSPHPLAKTFPSLKSTPWAAVVRGRVLRKRELTLACRQSAWVENREDH